MARTDTLTVPQSWTQLTNADATDVTVQVKSGSVYLVATVGATPPADFDNAVLFEVGPVEKFSLADLAPGTASATRIYAHAASPLCSVYISHA